jgi:RNA polymerase sigma factor (sigma-70 family)
MLQIAKNNALQIVNKKVKDNDKINKIQIDTKENYEETYLIESLKQILTEEEYYVFIAKTIHNLTYVEIGLLMGISKSNVCRIYQQATKKLRENL